MCYLLGLQDRHLQNILVDLNNGELIHIDYSDIFQPNLQRTYCPDILNFRLTKNFENLLGVFKAWGSFKSDFISLLRFLKENQLLFANYLEYSMRNLLSEGEYQRNYEKILEKFQNDKFLEIEKIVDKLIVHNSKEENIKHNFIGWEPDV